MGPINTNLLWMIGGTIAALGCGSAIRFVALRNSPADVAKARLGSLGVWWILVLLWSTAALVGQFGVAAILVTASVLATTEFLRLVATKKEIGSLAIASTLVLGAVHYLLIVNGNIQLAKWFLPITALLTLGGIRSLAGETDKYIRITASLYWGVMLLTYGLSHSLFLFHLDLVSDPVVGPAGWFLYLVILTEMNDIMQAIVGRKFGKHKITPKVSPNKSLEGLIGGCVSTVLLSVVLAPFLTTFLNERNLVEAIGLSAISGALISLVGFMGDLNMSAIKRDAGVKDGSSLFPGMGGMIDRIDSLVFTGPCFYYFVVLVNHFSI